MMGLLDALEDPKMALALGMLGAAGPSARPIGIGQALGMGMNEMQQQRMLNDRRKQMEMETLIRQQQMKQMEMQMLDQQKEREFFSNPSRFMVSPEQQALANGQGPTAENAAAVPSFAPKFDARHMYSELLNSGTPSLARMGIEGLSKQESPKLKEIKNFSIGGKVSPVMIFENGSVKTMQGMDVPPEIVMQNMGDRVVAINKNALTGGENYKLGVSPDAVYSGGITMRGQNMTDAREKEKIAAPQFDSATGAFVYKPTQSNPTGGVVPVPGFEKQKPMTEAQSKDSLFGARAARAHEILNALESGNITNPGLIKGAAESVPVIGGVLGSGINALPGFMGGPNEFQQQTGQARRDFINAVLRKESGAVISPEEFSNAEKQYFPQIGEGPSIIEQKRKNRELAIQGISLGAGSGKSLIESATEAGKKEGKNIKTPSKQVELEDGSKVLAKLGSDGEYYVMKGGKKYRVEE